MGKVEAATNEDFFQTVSGGYGSSGFGAGFYYGNIFTTNKDVKITGLSLNGNGVSLLLIDYDTKTILGTINNPIRNSYNAFPDPIQITANKKYLVAFKTSSTTNGAVSGSVQTTVTNHGITFTNFDGMWNGSAISWNKYDSGAFDFKVYYEVPNQVPTISLTNTNPTL